MKLLHSQNVQIHCFFNTMNKIIKSIMITRLNYAAKKHDLLLREHFDDRRNTVFKHALHYIVKRIHSIWANKKIIIMLLLKVTKAFDNVLHSRLLHNLRKRDIDDNYLIWVISFLAKRYITLRLMNHTTKRIKIDVNVSQEFFMFFILYIFYNANLIEWCINLDESSIIVDFIDDINILVTKNIAKENLNMIQTLYQHCDWWVDIHESLFVSSKYELIHFRILVAFFESKMTLRFLDHDLVFSL
jgi:hypothetical protein